MRRLTSAPKPAIARAVVHLAERRRLRRGSRSARRRSARGSSSLPPSRPGSRPGWRARCAAARRRRSPRPPRQRLERRVERGAHLRSTPSVRERARARRCAARGCRRSAPRCSRRRAPSRTSRRAGPVRRSPASASAASAPSRERSDLIERRRERDQAVARDAAVGRLEADDAAERGGLPDRAAGVRAERERHHRPRPRRPIRRSSRRASDPAPTGLRVGPNAEFSVDDPIANSSQLVLPTMTAPGRVEALDDGRRRTAGRSARASASRGRRDAARADVVLERDGTPRSGMPVPLVASARRAPRPARQRCSASTVRNAWMRRLAAAMRSSAARQTSDRGVSPRRIAAAMSRAVSRGIVTRALVVL